MYRLYFLTTIRIEEKGGTDCRCVGFYDELKVARDVLKKHSVMLGEQGWYKYAVIEAFSSGWYPCSEKEEWYQFRDRDKKVVKIEKPKRFRNTCNFAIG